MLLQEAIKLRILELADERGYSVKSWLSVPALHHLSLKRLSSLMLPLKILQLK